MQTETFTLTHRLYTTLYGENYDPQRAKVGTTSGAIGVLLVSIVSFLSLGFIPAVFIAVLPAVIVLSLVKKPSDATTAECFSMVLFWTFVGGLGVLLFFGICSLLMHIFGWFIPILILGVGIFMNGLYQILKSKKKDAEL